MLSRSLRFIFVLVACLGVTAVMAYSAKADGGRVQWHGLCIPAGKVSHLNPNSPLGKMMPQAGMDRTSGGAVTVEFSPEEMMKAIPGWTGYVPDPNGGAKLQRWLVVGLSLATPTNSGRLTNILRETYSLQGPYKGAKVVEIGGSGLYRVQSTAEHGPLADWSLLFIDPRANQKPPVENVHKWYTGECIDGDQGQDLETSCEMNYSDQGFTFDLSLNGANIKYAREVDAFLSKKVREWRAACKAKQQSHRGQD